MLTLDDIRKSKNVAELLDERELTLIGSNVVRGYEIDEDSRAEWKAIVDKAMDIAKQVMEQKSFPWVGAANIKMPVITRACIDYASRTLPEIIQNEKVVKSVVVGADPDGSKQQRADRVAKFMSYQLINQSPDWAAGTDSLLQTLPVLGTVFKKTYWCESENRCVSEMCVPDKIVVNYGTQSLDSARRVTHLLTMYTNDILERQRRGVYLDSVKMEELLPSDDANLEDEDYPIDILEQHCYLDLDEDDYKEPYVVTVHKGTGKVLRIVNRFKDVEKVDGKIVCIKPDQYFTDFHFIKSPDGGFYSMGFGSLLLPLNTAINTLVNQLLDAGTLSNTQGGFLGKGLRLKNGEFKFKMGEWKVVDSASGTNLKDSVYPLPVREPSHTLLQLLSILMEEAKDLTSATDISQGKQQAQNVASSTVSQLIDQGAKIFIAINQRVYRSLKKEYEKVYELNFHYLKQKNYMDVLADPQANVKADFELKSCQIYPVADAKLSSNNDRLSKAAVIQQLSTVDKRAADEMVLNALQVDDADKKQLMPPNPPPSPESQKIMAEIKQMEANISDLAANAAFETAKIQVDQAKMQQDIKESNSRIQESAARAWKMQQDALHNQVHDKIAAAKMQHDGMIKEANTLQSGAKGAHETAVASAKIQQEGEKTGLNAALKNKQLDIEAKANVAKSTSDRKIKGRYLDEDLIHTAKLKGISIQDVIGQLQPADEDNPPSEEDIQHTAKLKGLTPHHVKRILGIPS